MSKIEVITENEAWDKFNEYLDAYTEDGVDVMGSNYALSQILKAVDAIKYKETFLSWADMMAEDEVFLVEGYTTDQVVEIN